MNLALAIPHATRSVDTPAFDAGLLDDRLSALSSTRPPVLQQLRSQYPTACLLADLVQIHQDQFVIRAVVQVDNVVIVTALASDSTIEVAEDRARMRVLEALGLNATSMTATVTATVPIVSKVAATVPELAIAAEDEKVVEVEIMTMSKATKHRSKVAPIEPQAVEMLPPPESIVDPIVEPVLEAPVLEPIEPIVEPVLAAPVLEPIEPIVEVEPIESVSLTDPEPDLEETESIEISFEVEEVYEYTYEGEEIPIEPPAPIEVVSDPIVVPPAPIDHSLDLSDEIAQIGMEIDRIGWTKKQGSAYLQETYHKRTRAELTATELFSFLNYLKSLPAKLQPQLSQLPF